MRLKKIDVVMPMYNLIGYTTFFHKQSIFDPRPINCLSFSKKLLQKIVYQLFSNCFALKNSKRRHSLLQGHHVCNAHF